LCIHYIILAYSKEENAIVERANKEVLRHLRAESSIGTTPASLLFGNSITMDRGIFLPFPKLDDNNTYISLSAWSAHLIEVQAATLKAAQQHQLNKDNDHIRKADPRRSEFTPGSYVLISYPTSNLKKGPPSKLNTNLKGPSILIQIDLIHMILQ
jgi:hypothetical protein